MPARLAGPILLPRSIRNDLEFFPPESTCSSWHTHTLTERRAHSPNTHTCADTPPHRCTRSHRPVTHILLPLLMCMHTL